MNAESNASRRPSVVGADVPVQRASRRGSITIPRLSARRASLSGVSPRSSVADYYNPSVAGPGRRPSVSGRRPSVASNLGEDALDELRIKTQQQDADHVAPETKKKVVFMWKAEDAKEPAAEEEEPVKRDDVIKPTPPRTKMPSPGTLAVLRDLFAIMDTDGSNSIEPSELCILLRSLGYHPSPGEAEQIVNIFDTDGNGTLGFDEFVRVVGWKMGERDQVQTHRQTFALFAGGKSALAAKDLKRVARELDQELTEEDIAMILTESDLDGDGEVGWEDWVRVMAQGSL